MVSAAKPTRAPSSNLLDHRRWRPIAEREEHDERERETEC
jgi:hypothetical protein